MKAVVPTAGRGTRLYPHTHTKPKPMVRLAGRPILGHILENLRPTRVEEVVLVVGGPMREQVVEYAERHFADRFEFTFAHQERAEGLGHSIYQTESYVDGEPVLVALGDMLFQSGYAAFLDAHDRLGGVDASVGVKRVDAPEHYGVVELDGDRVIGLVEKPDDPPSNLAISGVYVVDDTPALFDALSHLVDNDLRGAGGEFQLTDALALMVERGSTLGTFPVEDWYDCGRPGTLLEANKVTLDRRAAARSDGSGGKHFREGDGAVVIEPVDIGENVEIHQSVVGPYVSVDDGTTITTSRVRDSIVGRNSTLRGVNLETSIVGDATEIVGKTNSLNVGDNSSLEL
ncbi:sugar phosphate nucleotidyltransferase [Halomarina litorea]|uniref:sugar phosphate nucleotidyltransferase n=1 Tax=Halomarina litorea TaxID=2961595 RepID=UPI0020C2E149|nr:sugar phosphate nucleotidyltransferase [Halomarina sp. BCD28]